MVNIMEATTQFCTAFNYYHFLDLGEGEFLFFIFYFFLFFIFFSLYNYVGICNIELRSWT